MEKNDNNVQKRNKRIDPEQEVKEYWEIKLMKEKKEKERKEKEKKQEDIGIIWRGDTKVNEKRSEILENICIALNASNVDAMPKLVESAFDVGYTTEEIKNRVRICVARPDFDVICEFCRAMHFEGNRRSEK